ncbi:DUF4139 domain-containing protein [Kordiimonas sp.]|uniref:DUF4139 domain-containing protein n=1 Tax=Kordiimonas sp. TaxID=1970157 RepID=UPI003A8C9127
MKPQLSVLPFLAIFAVPAAQADDFTLTAPINAVTVYQSGGAVVHREGDLTLPPGEHTITLMGLTSRLDENYGIHARADGVEVGGVRNKLSYMPQGYTGAQAALIDRLKAARAELAATENKIKAIDMRLAYLQGIGGGNTAGDPKSWQAALEFIGDTSAKLMSDKEALVLTRIEQSELVRALEREFGSLGGGSDQSYDAVITVRVPKSGDYSFDVSYLVGSARWGITTEADLKSDAKRADIALKAEVAQSSGEAWDDVRLSLSTARPSWTIAAPEMTPEFLRPRDREEYYADQMERVMPAPMAARKADGDRLEMASFGASQSATTYDMEFTINTLADVPTSGTPQQFKMDEVNLGADIITRVTPRFDAKNAYVYADVTLEGLPRLDNVTARLSRDGYYAGKGRWPRLVPGEKTSLPFGADSGIKVETITIPSRDGDTGFISKKNVVEEKLVYRITNERDKAATVEVTDRLPVSAHEDVKVEILKDSTPASVNDKDGKAGVIAWQKELAPGEVWEIHHEYRITYPSGKILNRSSS